MKRILYGCLVLSVCSTVFMVWYKPNIVSENAFSKPPAPPEFMAATVLHPAKRVTDFSLTDTEGNTFTEQSLIGHWTLMFFGYTECSQICPQTLALLTGVWGLLPATVHDENILRFIFVSLDPQNDTVESLQNFLGRFHPSFIGLTGNENVIKKLAQACSIYSWQDPNASASGAKVIDHSGTLLLLNPQGRIQALFSPPHQKEAIAKDINTIIHRPISEG